VQFLDVLYRSSTIVYTSKIGNLSEQVGVPPGVGSGYDRFEVLGGGVRVRLTRGVIIQVIPPHRSTEYADQAVTGRSGAPQGKARQIAANTKHGDETRAIREERSAKLAELYELEMLGRELGLISGSMVGRKLVKR